MISIPSPRYGAAKITDQRPHDKHGHRGSGHDAPFGTAAFDHFQIDPANNPNELVADLDAYALAEGAWHGDGLAHAGATVTIFSVGHLQSSRVTG